MLIKIYNEDCRTTMQRMMENNQKIDYIITSPPYNTRRSDYKRYDGYDDRLSNDEYIDFTIELFNYFDKVLNKNGCILYNMNYGAMNLDLMWLVVAKIIEKTPFMVCDDIIWKKSNAMPNNSSKNKLTRIVEHVFVICRKSEVLTFNTNRKHFKLSKKGQKVYHPIYNWIEAPNNDGSNPINKATYSTELVTKLMEIYVPQQSLVYDPFMGTGTTANACRLSNRDCIGSEISKDQCEYAYERLDIKQKGLNEFG